LDPQKRVKRTRAPIYFELFTCQLMVSEISDLLELLALPMTRIGKSDQKSTKTRSIEIRRG
jgi:hypothetical protein